MYIVDLSKLLPGDIILERDDGELSKIVRKLSKSLYSHALLYTGNSNCIDAGNIVKSCNLQRKLYKSCDDVCVLRLKKEFYDDVIVEAAICYVRMVVGQEYSMEDAKKIASHNADNPMSNRQICTRLIAQAFKKGNIELVENEDFPTTEDILQSGKLEKIDDITCEATEEDMAFAESQNVIDIQTPIIASMLEKAREVCNSDIQTLGQMLDYVLYHPEKDPELACIVKDSGYLEIWKKEENINYWLYNPEEFIKHFPHHTLECATSVRYSSICEKERYEQELMQFVLLAIQQDDDLLILDIFTGLYEQLVAQAVRRINVVEEVIKKILISQNINA